MIKVLIVDDDKLVRKGLISAMPWEQFDMLVVGEAGNGEKALEFLESHDVDLLITDLAMPVMSGIELIRIVCERFPKVEIAVLTMHQDFEYVQEALRLGAIDYIAKVQLEKEQFEVVLGRIYKRMTTSIKKHSNETEISIVMQDELYALLSLSEKPQSNTITSSHTLNGWNVLLPDQLMIWTSKEYSKKSSSEQSKGLSTSPLVAENEETPPLPQSIIYKEWKLVKLQNVYGVTREELLKRLRSYRKYQLFYDCDGQESYPIVKTMLELKQEYIEPDIERIELVKEGIHSFNWIHNEQYFYNLLQDIKELRLMVPKLMQLLYGVTIDWNRLFKSILQVDPDLPNSLLCWQDVEQWLSSFRKEAIKHLVSLQLNHDVSGSIMAAIKIIHEEFEMPLFAIDVAKRVNLSRSYFNECFKKLTNASFNEYLRKVRIEKAKEYLIKSTKSVVWIAEHTGYVDDKYFSRVFREQTGLLPSEFRQQYKQR